jgi:ribulose-5-phosphate 4-epimerase/fuculose-1-phosphate aldolase
MTQGPTISSAEQDLREQLAAVSHGLEKLGYTKLIFNHITARVPDEPEVFLVNPFGLFYDEVTAADFVRMRLDGTTDPGQKWPGNRAAWVIHGAIYAARPDVQAVIHTHAESSTILSTLEDGLLPITSEAALFQNAVAFHEYEGIATEADEQQRIARDLGQARVLVMRNHGSVVTGRSVAEAFYLNYEFEHAARIQIAALATGRPLQQISPQALAQTAQQMAGVPAWIDMLLVALRRRHGDRIAGRNGQ